MDPERFLVTTFAIGLPFLYGMEELINGSLLVVPANSVFLSDMTGTGPFFGDTPTGVIYQITAGPEPQTGLLVLLAGTPLLIARRRR